MNLSTIYKISFTLAAIDLMIATVCAASGDTHFIPFMILAGIMWAHGLYIKSKTQEKEGE